MIGNGIDKKTFEVLLKKVVAYYNKENKSLIYVPHRFEDIDYLEKISKKLNFKLTPFYSIVEFEFIMKGIDPSEIATFRTAAVDSLKIIYNPEIRIFKIPFDQIEKNKHEDYKRIYNNFKNKQYKIVELN